MKKLGLHIAFLIFSLNSSVFAQQISEYSQYLNNNYLINPAASDIRSGLNLQFSYRSQENVVFRTTDTYYISAFGSLGTVSPQQLSRDNFRLKSDLKNTSVQPYNAKLNQVIGGIVSRDQFGLVDRMTAHFNYGVHLPLNKKLTLSTAATLGYVGLNVTDEYFVLEQGDLPFDQFINSFQKESFVDVGLGLLLYSDQFHIGYSVQRLFRGNSLNGESEDAFNIKNQHFVQAAYKLKANKVFLIPSLLFRVDNRYGTALDMTFKAKYANTIWSSVSLRDSNILVLNLGLRITHQITFNYSYDLGAQNDRVSGNSANEFSIKLNL